MSDLDARFFDALHNTARLWQQHLNRELNHLGISRSGWLTITVAANADLPLSQSELADRVGIKHAPMVIIIDRLVQAGLVRRERSGSDRRIKRVVVTAAGLHFVAGTASEAQADRAQFLASLDRAKLEIATVILETVMDHIQVSAG